MRHPERYLTILGATFGCLCMLTVALTVAVDPYYIFGTPRFVGWNLFKPAAGERAAAAKTYLLERTHPRTLLLGNSRVEVGIDPESASWPSAMRPVFDAGLGSRGLSIAAKLLEDALADHGLRHVLVGVDVFDFLQTDDVGSSPLGPVYAGPDQDRVRVHPDLSPNPAHLLARIEDCLAATLTLNAVTDSLITVLAQHRSAPATMTPLGFNPLADYRMYVKLHGFRDLFDQKQAQYAARVSHYTHPDYVSPYRTASFRALREIIEVSRDHDVDVTLVVYPYHAWVLDLLRVHSLWGSFEDWKRALVRVVTELDPEHRTVRIVDFSGYNAYTTESPPLVGDTRTELRWYWEPGHFRSALGDRIIARLYGNQDEGFGRDLTLSTAEEVIRSIRDEASLFGRSGAKLN